LQNIINKMDKNSILSNLKITSLNAMQEAAGESIVQTDKDIVLLSPTGSGKTLAYLLPLVQMLDRNSDKVQAVVLVPGRELALQSHTVFGDMRCGLRSCCCYGGRPTMDEHRVIKDVKPQVIFATPGRLNDHLDKGNIDSLTIKYLVIDEFDKCLEMGFRDEMSQIVTKLYNLERHILLSATDAEEIPNFVRMGRTTKLKFLDDAEQVPDRISLYTVNSPEKDKLDTLNSLLCSLGEQSSIVFLNFRDSVERINEYLVKQGFFTSSFHGGMEQPDRESALYKFSNGSANIFVSTDLASRGLDIPNIENVIHYHLPLNEDGYIHRVGRTARWEAKGRAFFILGPDEQFPDYIKDTPVKFELPTKRQKPVQPRMATIYIGKGKKDKISKMDIVGFLCKKGGLKNDEIGRIDIKERYAYAAIARTKQNQVLKQVRGEKIKGIRTIVENVK
jgi:ATP-dependent RNA helicase DbpA